MNVFFQPIRAARFMPGGSLPAKAEGFAIKALVSILVRSKSFGTIPAMLAGNLARRLLASFPAAAACKDFVSIPLRAPMAPLAKSAGVLKIAKASHAARAFFPTL
jgi:hypothetical protein